MPRSSSSDDSDRKSRSRLKKSKRDRRQRSESSESSSLSSATEARSAGRSRKRSSSSKKDRKRKRSSSSSSSSSPSSYKPKKRAKEKKKKKKHKKEKKKKKKKEKSKERKKTEPVVENISSSEKTQDTKQSSVSPPRKFAGSGQSVGPSPRIMKPMTKDEWEKQQSVMRHVYDEESGRTRLIKGDGEIMEEIVSKDRHKDINKTATQGDGRFFASKMGLL